MSKVIKCLINSLLYFLHIKFILNNLGIIIKVESIVFMVIVIYLIIGLGTDLIIIFIFISGDRRSHMADSIIFDGVFNGLFWSRRDIHFDMSFGVWRAKTQVFIIADLVN